MLWAYSFSAASMCKGHSNELPMSIAEKLMKPALRLALQEMTKPKLRAILIGLKKHFESNGIDQNLQHAIR